MLRPSVSRVFAVCPALLAPVSPCWQLFGRSCVLTQKLSPLLRDSTVIDCSAAPISAWEEKQTRKGKVSYACRCGSRDFILWVPPVLLLSPLFLHRCNFVIRYLQFQLPGFPFWIRECRLHCRTLKLAKHRLWSLRCVRSGGDARQRCS